MTRREWITALKLMAVGAWLGIIIANAARATPDGQALGIALGVAAGAIFYSEF